MNIENDFFKKKDHKVTIKQYGFLYWGAYNMQNYKLFKVLVNVVASLIGILVGIMLGSWLKSML